MPRFFPERNVLKLQPFTFPLHTATTLERAYFRHPVKMQKFFKTCILTKFPLKFWKEEEDNSPVILTWIFYFQHQSCLLLLSDIVKPRRDPPSHICADTCLSWLARITRYGEGRKIPSIGSQLVLSSKKKKMSLKAEIPISQILPSSVPGDCYQMTPKT